jgi:preflagellin peptidase FlaK
VDVLEVVTGSTVGSLPDLLRLAVVPVFGWAAWRDVKTRRVPNRTWLPLLAVGLLALAIEAWQVWTGNTPAYVDPQVYLLRVTISLGFVVPLAYGFWWIGGFGGADAKALITLAVVFPTFPTYYLPTEALPVVVPTLGVFAMTVLSNTVVVGIFYPVALTLRNAVAGHVAKAMVIGRPVTWDGVPTEYGRLLETPEGFTRRGLDLDALRMYLNWRGATLADLRDDPESHRDPGSLPTTPNPPGDGSIPVADGGSTKESEDPPAGQPDDEAAIAASAKPDRVDPDTGDAWGAEAFLDSIEGTAYGTSPEQLRDSLEVLTTDDEVWITPGIPFLVPMFFGLLVALTYGDVLYAIIEALGLV